VVREVVLQGKRFPGPLAMQRKIVDDSVPRANLTAKAIEMSHQFAPKRKDRRVYSELKRAMNSDLVSMLRSDTTENVIKFAEMYTAAKL